MNVIFVLGIFVNLVVSNLASYPTTREERRRSRINRGHIPRTGHSRLQPVVSDTFDITRVRSVGNSGSNQVRRPWQNKVDRNVHRFGWSSLDDLIPGLANPGSGNWRSTQTGSIPVSKPVDKFRSDQSNIGQTTGNWQSGFIPGGLDLNSKGSGSSISVDHVKPVDNSNKGISSKPWDSSSNPVGSGGSVSVDQIKPVDNSKKGHGSKSWDPLSNPVSSGGSVSLDHVKPVDNSKKGHGSKLWDPLSNPVDFGGSVSLDHVKPVSKNKDPNSNVLWQAGGLQDENPLSGHSTNEPVVPGNLFDLPPLPGLPGGSDNIPTDIPPLNGDKTNRPPVKPTGSSFDLPPLPPLPGETGASVGSFDDFLKNLELGPHNQDLPPLDPRFDLGSSDNVGSVLDVVPNEPKKPSGTHDSLIPDTGTNGPPPVPHDPLIPDTGMDGQPLGDSNLPPLPDLPLDILSLFEPPQAGHSQQAVRNVAKKVNAGTPDASPQGLNKGTLPGLKKSGKSAPEALINEVKSVSGPNLLQKLQNLVAKLPSTTTTQAPTTTMDKVQWRRNMKRGFGRGRKPRTFG